MDRRTARETVFMLLFEKEFRPDEVPEDIKRRSEDCMEFLSDSYVEQVFYGVLEKKDEIDKVIEEHAIGWKTGRMSKCSLSIMRLALYEMLYMEDIPFSVSINEAVEIAKKFDHDKAPAFINGILNSAAVAKGLKA